MSGLESITTEMCGSPHCDCFARIRSFRGISELRFADYNERIGIRSTRGISDFLIAEFMTRLKTASPVNKFLPDYMVFPDKRNN